jgi:HPt (histidine-containing phosphotransfer) domain-containing protein
LTIAHDLTEQSAPAPSADCASLDQEAFQTLVQSLGREVMNGLLDRLASRLETPFFETGSTFEEVQQLARDAHMMVGSAGALGFTQLSSACQELEAACQTAQDLDDVLERVRTARQQALADINALRSAA